MSTSIISHSIMSIGNMMSNSMYNYVWNNNKSNLLHHPPDYGPAPSTRTKHAERDRIDSLPGLATPQNQDFAQFSGYLSVSPTREVFYWYIESLNDPSEDPIVLWSNGGPSCSGLIGFFTEHGPFRVDEYLNLYENPYAWNQMANMLYIEQPAGVGFSYRDPDDSTPCNDKQSAADNLELIYAFFERFPERKTNPFYLASESYGGHYIPQLSLEILKHNGNVSDERHINFQGFMLGNPYVDPYSNFIAEVEALYSHGLLPRPLMQTWRETCANRDSWQSHDCEKVNARIYEIVEPGFNVYALDFPVCLPVTTSSLDKNKQNNVRTGDQQQQQHRVLHAADKDAADRTDNAATHQVRTLLSASSIHNPSYLPPEDVYEPCGQLYMREYLSQASVQKAIHVRSDARVDWSPCSPEKINYDLSDVEVSVIDAYKKLVTMGQNDEHALRMLIFSGDDDSVCATDGTQAWLYDLGAEPKHHITWKPWKMDGQVAGFWTSFDMKESRSSFAFATVHGAGHEVPTYRPMEALELFRLFLVGYNA